MTDDALILIKLLSLLAYDTIAVALLTWGVYVVVTTWRDRR